MRKLTEPALRFGDCPLKNTLHARSFPLEHHNLCDSLLPVELAGDGDGMAILGHILIAGFLDTQRGTIHATKMANTASRTNQVLTGIIPLLILTPPNSSIPGGAAGRGAQAEARPSGQVSFFAAFVAAWRFR